MFKLYSKGCQYALRVLAFVLVEQGGSRVVARDLCERLSIPESYSRKVLQALVQSGLLEAHRGPGGGYSLGRNPHEIRLLDVIYAVDGDDIYQQCVLGLATCTPESPCPLHPFWKNVRHQLIDALAACTLADISGTAFIQNSHTALEKNSPAANSANTSKSKKQRKRL